ncbi:MAG: TRAP transporter permease [Desulfurococcales archaeon]|nr:TRAP transporter permease [Desulfurococcales archaeon]
MGTDAEKKLKALLFERGKTGKGKKAVFAIAAFFAFLEIFYILPFNETLFRFFRNLGWTSELFLQPDIFNQLYPAKAIVLAIIVGTAFILYPFRRTEKYLKDEIPWYDWVLAFIGFLLPLYIVYLYVKYESVESAIERATLANTLIIIFIIAFIAEATRRAMGWVLPTIMIIFSLYGFFYAYTTRPTVGVEEGQWVRRLLNLFVAQNTGFLGIPLEVMVTYVFIFLFFSSVLDRLGIGRYITDLILSLVGKRPGGPAKVAVVSSALMGTISGSSVANTLTTGTFTIPTMKRAGFPPEVAGAIEPVASTGGQLMPPIMGAAAFIMAEFIGRPYRDIIIAAALPAVIYFYSIYIFVDKKAKALGVRGMSDEELPNFKKLIKKIYMVLPIPIIVFTLLKLEPQDAVMAAVSSAVIIGWIGSEGLKEPMKLGLILAVAAVIGIVAQIGGLGFATGLFVAGVISIVLGIIAAYLDRGAKYVADALIGAVDQTLRNSVPVFLAAAVASVIQAMITFTGLDTKLAHFLLTASMGNLYLLLIMTAVFSIILGMGVPTTANYIITATILAPAIVSFAMDNLGYTEEVALIAAHMFVFYYGILADITPPVALAAFVGAALAKADFWKTAINATIFGFAKYIIPFVIVSAPTILLVTVDQWDMASIASLLYAVAALLIIIHTASSGFTGYLAGLIENKTLRAIMVVISILAVSIKPYFVAASLALLVGVYIYNTSKKRGAKGAGSKAEDEVVFELG